MKPVAVAILRDDDNWFWVVMHKPKEAGYVIWAYHRDEFIDELDAYKRVAYNPRL